MQDGTGSGRLSLISALRSAPDHLDERKYTKGLGLSALANGVLALSTIVAGLFWVLAIGVAGVPSETSWMSSIAVLILGGAVGMVLKAIADVFAHGRRRKSQKEHNGLAQSRYALFLRPFVFDQRAIDVKIGAPMEESLAAVCLEARTALVSIGHSGNEFGARALRVTDKEWQPAALRLLRDAKLILLFPGPSKGSVWEIEQVLGESALSRTLWLMPPLSVARKSKVDLSDSWREVANKCKSLGLDLPQYYDDGAVFAYGFDAAGQMEYELRPFNYGTITHAVAAFLSQPQAA